MPPVHLRRSWEIQWQDGKWHSIPGSLIEEFEGRSFLRFRPTNYTLIGLLSPGHSVKNASMASSSTLSNLIEARNAAALQLHSTKAKDEGDNAALFDKKEEAEEEANSSDSGASEEDKKTMKKRKRTPTIPPGDYTVKVPVGDAEIECLLRGKRPKSSDLMVAMTSEGLEALLVALAKDVDECLNADRRQYKKKAKK